MAEVSVKQLAEVVKTDVSRLLEQRAEAGVKGKTATSSITDEEKSADTMAGGFEKDDLYDEAARIVVSSGQASISYLQRRLRIGFSRAARLVDMMEAEGLVSSGQGGKARELLVPKDYFDEVDAQLR